MLVYLDSKSCPNTAFATHQCAFFTHAPCQSHAKSVTLIIRYITVTEDNSLIIEHYHNQQVNCYIVTECYGLWGIDEDQNPICVKSCAGFIIMFIICLLIWFSKLQSKNFLTTMEAEYIAL